MTGPPFTWDVLVVGAGPAGAVAARQLAHRDLSVLLVDRARFPRPKVCGCCINRSALETLSSIGLGRLATELGAVPLRRFRLFTHRRSVSVALPGGVSVSRRAFDWALVRLAVEAGAAFIDGTSASLDAIEDDRRRVHLRGTDRNETVSARLVLAADGLGGRLLANQPGVGWRVARRSRLGASAQCDAGPTDFEPGVITMACGPRGYVGLVRLEDARLDIAAAFDPQFVKAHRGPGRAARAILDRARLPAIEDIENLDWRGTPRLTRARAIQGAERVLILGDASGYVEPFTGEGIAWALASARAIEPFAAEAVSNWRGQIVRSWTDRHRRLIRRRQQLCRLIRVALRHSIVVEAIAASIARAPALSEAVVRAINAPLAVKPSPIPTGP